MPVLPMEIPEIPRYHGYPPLKLARGTLGRGKIQGLVGNLQRSRSALIDAGSQAAYSRQF